MTTYLNGWLGASHSVLALRKSKQNGLPDCLEAIWHSRYESVSMEILILENLSRFTAESVKLRSQ